MKYLFNFIVLAFITTNALANEKFDNIVKKSAELNLGLKQCGLCVEKRNELESFNTDKLIPELVRVRKIIQKKPSVKTSRQIIEIAIANKDSASEFFSDSLADVFLSDQKIFKNLVKKLNEKSERQHVLEQTEWGLKNHTQLPKKKLNTYLKKLQAIKDSAL